MTFYVSKLKEMKAFFAYLFNRNHKYFESQISVILLYYCSYIIVFGLQNK